MIEILSRRLTNKILRNAGFYVVPAVGIWMAGCHVQRHTVASAAALPGIEKVGHVVVIYMENHSFDNLYGQFPGADGLSVATTGEITQVDSNGQPYPYLPPIAGNSAFPTNLLNGIFNIDQYVASNRETPDVLHRWYQEQLQIDAGKMDKFALYNTSKGLTMGVL